MDDDVRFVLHGDGKRRPALEELVRQRGVRNVVFSDPLPDKESVARLAAASDACMTIYKDVPVLYTCSPNATGGTPASWPRPSSAATCSRSARWECSSAQLEGAAGPVKVRADGAPRPRPGRRARRGARLDPRSARPWADLPARRHAPAPCGG